MSRFLDILSGNPDAEETLEAIAKHRKATRGRKRLLPALDTLCVPVCKKDIKLRSERLELLNDAVETLPVSFKEEMSRLVTYIQLYYGFYAVHNDFSMKFSMFDLLSGDLNSTRGSVVHELTHLKHFLLSRCVPEFEMKLSQIAGYGNWENVYFGTLPWMWKDDSEFIYHMGDYASLYVYDGFVTATCLKTGNNLWGTSIEDLRPYSEWDDLELRTLWKKAVYPVGAYITPYAMETSEKTKGYIGSDLGLQFKGGNAYAREIVTELVNIYFTEHDYFMDLINAETLSLHDLDEIAQHPELRKLTRLYQEYGLLPEF